MSETLYRKYRPKNFSEIIGQAHIVRTLSGSIKKGRIGQAYLFTGPRGTGKTSIARIFSKAVNCENSKDAISCEKCPSCEIINSGKSMDIFEIDAASNTGVDNIRELRQTVNLASASLKYKVYIIDEVHMLSTGAFNALLKTLEEPPAHVIFILATTEIHKVPDTIISRCQRFDFSRLPINNIIEKLELIAKSEKVKIEKEALEMIALSAEGGMRDAESLLGQIISLEDKNITVKEVEEILGTAGRSAATEMAQLILEKKSSEAVGKINELLEEGYDLQVFNKSLINYLRQLMLVKISPELEKYFSFEISKEQLKKMADLAKNAELSQILSAINLFLEAQGKISSSILPQLPLEIAIIRATQTFPVEKRESIKYDGEDIKKDLAGTGLKPAPHSVQTKPVDSKISETDCKPISTEEKTSQNEKDIDIYTIKQNWNKLLVEIRPFNHSLSALLSNCQPIKTEGNQLFLATAYSFYFERLNDHKNKLTIEDVLGKILGSKIRVNIILDKDMAPVKEDSSVPAISPSEQKSLLTDALEIIGGKVVE